ncbi:DUF4129 domain-containing protein [Planococcus versutus]|uniref:DUF4129 domain-containing protein n=1 Tax=Planococcus versutus TaxID=1302659 RepID=A0A1B1S3R3_9BACL|nr:DUF4129 domain-containing protein [Planococcus versutus]ANU27812.1 hypothetical protein I858_012540 [Planococcus versutus]
MSSRLISSIYFMLDAFIISLVLVFVSQEMVLPVAWSWLLGAFFASIIAFAFFSKFSYQLLWVIGISSILAVSMWMMNVPLWLVLILGILLVYMLHERYSSYYDEFNTGHHFLMKFLVVFSVCWVFLLLNPDEQSSRLLFTIVPMGVLFYVTSHLLYHYLYSKLDGAHFGQAITLWGILLSIPTIAAFVTFFIADEVRSGVGWVLGGMIRIVFWPLALVLEQISEFLSGLSPEEEMQETIDKLGPDEEAVQNETVVSDISSTDFPVEILLSFIVLACIIVLVLWLRKVKPDIQVPVKESVSSIKRYDHNSTESVVSLATKSTESTINLHQIREVFRELERAANSVDLGREDYETVREWVRRMQWDVTDSFYNTYDRVRYGDKQLPQSQATKFIAEIEKIKEIYLKENV